MAPRAKPKAKKASASKGKVPSRGTVATLPKQTKGKKRRMGDNSGKIPDEVYERHLAKIDTTGKAMDKAKEAYDQAKGVHQSAFKAAKGDGCDIDAIRLARKLDKQDAGVTQVTYANAARVLNLMGSALGEEQLNLFGSIVEPPPKVDVALQGQQAGKNAEPASNNPYLQGTEDHVIWSENHKVGIEQAKASFQ